jgi:predicted secreted acid phosphatase
MFVLHRTEEAMTALGQLRRVTLAAFAALALPSAHPLAQSAQPIPSVSSPALRQPPNVGEAKAAATGYHDSGDYARDLASVASAAGAWIAQRAPQVSRPALVLDIDDTALTNWEVIRADDFGRIIDGRCDALPEGPCGWAAWDLLGKAPVIEPTLRLFQQARTLNIAVFFITGRPESQRAATEQNLRNVGYDGYAGLYMVPQGARYTSAAAFKGPVRATIERDGYTIIANMGDQPSDLAGGHAERTFLLPNPFYRIP